MKRKFTSIGILPEDHKTFSQIASRREIKLYELFHEWVQREMKNEVV